MSVMAPPRITFAEYMDHALYGPGGYYASGQAKSGRDGDYFTAPDVGPAMGHLLALIFQSWQKKLGLSSFLIVECGAGEGRLAESLRSASNFTYTAIERSPARQKILQSKGFETQPDLESLAPFSGILFANELLDAFPVHRVRIHNGKLEEAYVNPHPQLPLPPQGEGEISSLLPEEGEGLGMRVVWDKPSTPRLQAYLDRIHVELPEGYETEINLAMPDWFRSASQALKQGLLLLIDYGRPAHEYYAPERTSGTLRGFSGHKLVEVSRGVDLTADVDFTSAALDAREAGFTPLAFMEMGSFLLEAAALMPAANPVPKGLKTLLHPDAMGSAFHVLVVGKNVSFTEKDFPHNRIRRLGLEE